MKWMVLLGKIALVASLQAQETKPAVDGSNLLDKVISHPGSYSQVCDVMTSSSDIPYRAYELSDFSGASLSKANLEAIGKNRDALVRAIRARLLAIDLTKEAKQPSEDPAPETNNDGETYGNDPNSLNPLLLVLIQQLHATETLPELLVVEQKLVDGIAKAKEDVKTVPPIVTGWFVGQENYDYDENEPAAKRDRRNNLFQARVAQRDLVILMASLMREKSYALFLETKLEAAYVKGIKASAKEFKLPSPAPGEPLPEEHEGWKIDKDPVTGTIRRAYNPVLVPYSRESRDEVRAAASKWISEH